MATLDAKQEALKKELEQLGIQKEQLHNLILEIDEIITNKQSDVSRLRKEHIIIAQTPVLTDVDFKTLETLQEALRIQRDELACLCGCDHCTFLLSFSSHYFPSFIIFFIKM